MGLIAGEVPNPVIETFNGLLMVRSLVAACRLEILDTLAEGPLSAIDVASRAGTSPVPTERLLDVLVSLRYVRRKGDTFELLPVARRWLLKDSPDSVRDYVLWRHYEWEWISRLDDHVRTGASILGRGALDDDAWQLYQRAMRCLANLGSPEIAARTPVPQGATTMLDIGGAHGHLSATFCRRHPAMKAVVLELPEAIQASAPLLASENLGDRVVHRAGDARTDDFGDACWDLVVASNIVHNLTSDQCTSLTVRVARSLKPGGVFAIIDFTRPTSERATGQTPALMDLYFSLTSVSGAWSIEEMAHWQQTAGLKPYKALRMRRGAGSVIQAAKRPA
jgi:SAM-dependent methyltransferase